MNVLSSSEIEMIHSKTIEILQKAGVEIGHPAMCEKCRQAGAKVDDSQMRVYFPAGLVNELLSCAPRIVKETGINERGMDVGSSNNYFTSLILDPWVVDYHEGLRPPVLEDVRRNTIIGESLERVDAMMRMHYPVSDVKGSDSYYKTMEVFLSNSTKHTAAYPVSVENCRDWMDIMAVIADAAGLDVDNTPLLSIATAVTSPLRLTAPNVEIMKMAMERCYPIIPTVCPMAGTTAPFTVAGTTLQSNVECVLTIILTQLYKPGHPVFYGVGPSVTNMQTGHDLYYTSEKMLWKIAASQMGSYYNVPVSGEAGGTLTWRPDVQNGAEGALFLLASLVGNQHMISGLGSLHNANGMSSEQIIMQCGLIDMAEYVSKGINITEQSLAAKSIIDVGPGGNFMADELTLSNLRSDEFFSSHFLDFSGGYEKDSPGMYEKAHSIVEDTVAAYDPQVPGNVREAIKKFFYEKYQDKQVAKL
jgi:trimethylamine--corrinoid protein Co-methyltransferase